MIQSWSRAAILLVALPGLALAVDPALRKKARSDDSFERSAAARELARDGSPEAAKLLVDLLQDRDVYTRDHTVSACGKLDAADAIDIIGKLASDPDEHIRVNVMDALGRTGEAPALPWLAERARKDRSAIVRATALDGLWAFKGQAEAAALGAQYVGDGDPFVRAAAIEAVGRLRLEGSKELVEKALGDADVGVRCVAWMELRYVDPEQALARLPEAIGDPDWRIRAQAVDDALHLRQAPAVDGLLVLLADENLRVSAGAHRALASLSGKGFGRDTEIWKSWWEQARATWEAPDGSLSKPASEPDSGKTRATYHGVEVTSDRLVFVIDASGSMKQPVVEKGRETRWQRASRELETTIAALPDETRVNVVLFQRKIVTAFPKAVALSKKSRKTLSTVLKRTSPGERGDLLAALETALAMDDVDTVYLLSDGAPSTGRMVDKGRVRRAVRQVNRMRKVAIHCIGFGARSKAEQSFLAGVARDAGAAAVFPQE